MRIKKGDQVIIITGKERGLKGRVRQVLPKQNKVIIEGRNLVKRHLKQGPQGQEGGILPKEAPIHVSNVMLFSEKRNRGVRVKYAFVGANEELFSSRGEAKKSFGEEVPAHIRKVRYAEWTLEDGSKEREVFE